MNQKAEIKPGYKKTKLGWIPEDWNFDTLHSITKPDDRYGIVDGPFGSNLKTIHYRKSGIPIITSGYVTNLRFQADDYLYVEEEKFEQEKRSTVRGGDIVVAKIGANCGASAILPLNHPVGILSGNALKISVDNSRHSTDFIWQSLVLLYQKKILDKLRGIGAQPALSMASLKKQKMPLPPLPEQKKIAEILSTWDDAIQKQQELIEKKKQLKKGLMQQLLTGKKRFPEFVESDKMKKTKLGWIHEDWNLKELKDIGTFKKGKGISRSDLRAVGVPCVLYGDIYTKYGVIIDKFYSFINEDTAKNSYEIRQNDILFTGSGETLEEIGMSTAFVGNEKAYAGGDIIILSVSDCDTIFLSYLLRSALITKQKRSLGQGHSVVHIYSSGLQKVQIPLPPLPEQKKIAEILSAADDEIASLEKGIDLLQSQKKGLMQILLTGKKRVQTN